MSIISFIKTIVLLNLLCWYRKHFDLDVDGVISPLDETINQIAYRIEDDQKEPTTI